jgi:hypothetical protein
MIKMQIIMDDKKIKSEGKYSVQKIVTALDNLFLHKLGFEKSYNGFYLGLGDAQDYGKFGYAFSQIYDKAWFIDNVKTWLYYISDEETPDDFAIEDMKAQCQNELRKTG